MEINSRHYAKRRGKRTGLQLLLPLFVSLLLIQMSLLSTGYDCLVGNCQLSRRRGLP